jgi:hypothetical protein
MAITKIVDDVRTTTALDATKLSGNIDATQLSGNVPTGSITAASVTQHSPPPDLTPVHQAIATLGLHTAVSDNKAAFNLPNAFIDTFEDDTGIATETTADRNASEYVSSTVSSAGTPAYVTGDRQSTITVTHSGFVWAIGTSPNLVNGSIATDASNSANFTAGTPSAGSYIRFQFSTSQLVTESRWKADAGSTTGAYGVWQWQGSNNGSTWTDIGANTFLLSGTSYAHISLSGNTTAYTYYQVLYVSGTVSAGHWIHEVEFEQASSTTTTNATGTLVSTVQTAPVATTTLSGVILYTDDAGTNTIGTDLEIYLTANLQGTTPNWTGTNWTEAASYGTAQTFSGTTKQVKLGKTTVTSGTAVALKGVWANQAATIPAVAGGFDSGDRTSTITVTTDATTNRTAVTGLSILVNGAVGGTNQFYFNSSQSGRNIRFQFSSAKKITGIKMYNDENSTSNQGTWKWQGSNTSGGASGYVDIGSTFSFTNTSLVGGAGGYTVFGDTMSGNTTAYLYYQMLQTSGTTSSNSNWQEIYFNITGASEVVGKVAQLNGWAVNY